MEDTLYTHLQGSNLLRSGVSKEEFKLAIKGLMLKAEVPTPPPMYHESELTYPTNPSLPTRLTLPLLEGLESYTGGNYVLNYIQVIHEDTLKRECIYPTALNYTLEEPTLTRLSLPKGTRLDRVVMQYRLPNGGHYRITLGAGGGIGCVNLQRGCTGESEEELATLLNYLQGFCH